MEEQQTRMRDMKIISFRLYDYKKFIKAISNDKIMFIIFAILGVVSYLFMYYSQNTNNTIYAFSLWSLLFFAGGFIILIFSFYWNSINDIDTSAWGVSIAPIISYIFCYKFLSGVSFDKTFIIGASIILSWIFTKFILSVCKDIKR